jgi:GT2 family glycosyltransferase
MPPRTPRPQFPGHVVTAVLVCHDGGRWVADCLAALTGQTRAPQRVVAVDTGADPEVRAALTDALGESAVVGLPVTTPLATAVQAGIDAFASAPQLPAQRRDAIEWVWVLHDDCAPDPTALQELLARATQSPSASVIGAKALTWDRSHLLEVGITVDTSGQRRTGVDVREVDQGQHDDVGDVLAVGTAGMLVRRDTWDRLGGLDPTWPLFGDDVDFGWRVTSAGGRVMAAPRAVVRHAAALEHHLRRADAVAGRPGVAARRNGMQVVLANTAAPLVPLLFARFVVEGVFRTLVALLLMRSAGTAADELLATVSVMARPDVVFAARKRRRAMRERPHADIRPLLAPPGLRWRAFTDQLAATFSGPRAVDERLRRRGVPVETGPVSDEAESLEVDHGGLLRRMIGRPAVLLALGLLVVGLVADRGLLGGVLHGGRLLPAPAGARDLWSAYTAAWHPVGLGSTTPAPAWLAVLGAVSTLLLGKAWLALDVLLLGAVPLAGLSAYAASRAVTRSLPVRIWIAATYALLPAVTGAVAGGRLDVVVVTVLLPLVIRACAAALAIDTRRHGWHRSAGAGLLLALAAAFHPFVWVLAAAAMLVAVGVEWVPARAGAGVAGRRLVAAAAVLAVAALVLLPWTGTVLSHPTLLLSGIGLPETFGGHQPQPVAHLLLLRPDGPAQPPLWVLGPLGLAALVGLARSAGRTAARTGFVMFVVGVAGALAQSRLSEAAAGRPDTRYWTGAALAFAAVGALTAAGVAADNARQALARHSFGWRQPVAALLAVAALAGTVACGLSWMTRGAAGPLTDRPAALLPVFAAAEVGLPTSPRVLAVRTDGALVRYAVLRRAGGPQLGDADLAPAGDPAALDRADRLLADAVRRVVAARPQAVRGLSEFAIGMVVTPQSASGLLDRLAGVEGLSRVGASGAVVYRTATRSGELMVVPAGTGPATPLPMRGDRADTRLPEGPAGRHLQLAEAADRHWRARLDGRTLPPVTGGWAEAWALPPGGGRLVVDRVGDRRGRWLGLELALVAGALLLSVPSRRFRRGRDVIGEADG